MGHRRSRRRRQCAATIPAQPSLMEELVEEILLRLSPQEPASLLRAALVCKSWRRLVSSRRFRRRFLEFHRTPPMLGYICNYRFSSSSVVPTTTASSSPLHNITRWRSWCALDARHGRVLLRENLTAPPVLELVVWDPIRDEQWDLPVLPWPTVRCTAAVLCAATATGAVSGCSHHGCHRGPFRVVCVGDMFVCSYSSDVGAWSQPISIQRIDPCYGGRYSPGVLLGNQLYFGIPLTSRVLKYDLELHEISWIQLPTIQYRYSSVLTTTDDGGLGLVTLTKGVLCIWLRMDTPEADAGWTKFKVIDLGKQLHVRPHFIYVVGFADGLGVVFVTLNDLVKVNGITMVKDALYTVDLKTCMVKKQVYDGFEMDTVFPYMHFYSPALEATSTGEEPSAAGSST